MNNEEYLKERAKIELFKAEQEVKQNALAFRLHEMELKHSFYEALQTKEKEIIDILTAKKYALTDNVWGEDQIEEIDSMLENIDFILEKSEELSEKISDWMESYKDERIELSRQKCLIDVAVKIQDTLLMKLLREYLAEKE